MVKTLSLSLSHTHTYCIRICLATLKWFVFCFLIKPLEVLQIQFCWPQHGHPVRYLRVHHQANPVSTVQVSFTSGRCLTVLLLCSCCRIQQLSTTSDSLSCSSSPSTSISFKIFSSSSSFVSRETPLSLNTFQNWQRRSTRRTSATDRIWRASCGWMPSTLTHSSPGGWHRRWEQTVINQCVHRRSTFTTSFQCYNFMDQTQDQLSPWVRVGVGGTFIFLCF